jgi:mRNA interferase RelE/StbE
MIYSIFYKRSASDELLKIPANNAHKVLSAINSLSETPRPQNSKKLKGSINVYRIRVGNYRVVYTIADSILIITVIKIGHRKDVYR